MAALSWQEIAIIAGLIGTLVTLLWRVFTLHAMARQSRQDIDQIQAELKSIATRQIEFRERVFTEYVPSAYMQGMRKEILDELHALRKQISQLTPAPAARRGR